MPFNASGIFQRLFTFTTDRDNGTKIRADRMDAEFDNVKAAIDDITGNNFEHRGSIKAAQGGRDNLSYSFVNDLDTGFYRPASDAISVQTGGTERARFTDAGLSVGGSRVLTQADEGAGKGLDADTLDGQEGAFYQNAANLNAGLVPTARLSGTYAINISGTAATATNAGNADTVDGLHASAFYRQGHATNITSENGYFFSDSASETDNANYYLRDEKSALTGVLYWERNDNIVRIAQYNNGQFGSWLGVGNGTVKFNGQTMWHAGNDGAGSGLDADKLDGFHANHFMPVTGGVFQGNVAFSNKHNYLHLSSRSDGSLELNGGTGTVPTGGHFALRGAASGHNAHGMDVHVGGAERLRLDSSGALHLNNQPALVVSRNTQTENWGVGTHVGIVGAFHTHRGGFYSGSLIGGSGHALHVPKTGYYHVTLNVYFVGAGKHRLNIIRNGNTADNIAFCQPPPLAGDMKQSATNIRHLNAGDWLSYYVPILTCSAYHAHNHTQVSIAFLG